MKSIPFIKNSFSSRKVVKVDTNSEKVSKGLFARVCIEIDVSRPSKMEVRHARSVIHGCFINYENINICYGCGSPDHKLDSCRLNAKCISFITGHPILYG